MKPPAAEDFFMNVFSAHIHEEENSKPGSKDWEQNRARMLKYWRRVWMDCRELAIDLQDLESSLEKSKQKLEEP